MELDSVAELERLVLTVREAVTVTLRVPDSVAVMLEVPDSVAVMLPVREPVADCVDVADEVAVMLPVAVLVRVGSTTMSALIATLVTLPLVSTSAGAITSGTAGSHAEMGQAYHASARLQNSSCARAGSAERRVRLYISRSSSTRRVSGTTITMVTRVAPGRRTPQLVLVALRLVPFPVVMMVGLLLVRTAPPLLLELTPPPLPLLELLLELALLLLLPSCSRRSCCWLWRCG